MISRVAVVKPDHLGDLVLASPAMRAIHSHYQGNVSFFTSSTTQKLLKFFFPAAYVHSVDFPYLARTTLPHFDLDRLIEILNQHEFVFFLRDDSAMREVGSRLTVPHEFSYGGHLTHETAIHKRALVKHIPNYSRTAHFSGNQIFWPSQLRRVGLCIAAGFPTNRWANVYWLKLAKILARKGIAITLIGGPGERQDLQLLSRSLPRISPRVVQGCGDFGQFFDEISDVDLVVASDGGTAHLCSLKKPMLSIFGSSPWRRYAPFGHSNVLLTRDLVCSPCTQFSSVDLNGCMTRECSNEISPAMVAKAVVSNGIDFSALRGLRVERAVSHKYED